MIDFKSVFSLDGKTALGVGGGGLGRAIASALMQNGADPIMADINPSAMDDVKAETEAAGKRFFALGIDLLDEAGVNRMVAEAKSKLGRIDILVNAAGINILKRAEEYDGASWDKVLGINLRGLHLTTRAVGRVMIEQKYGRILSISSVKAFIGTDQDYTARWWTGSPCTGSVRRRTWAVPPYFCAAMRRNSSPGRFCAWTAALRQSSEGRGYESWLLYWYWLL